MKHIRTESSKNELKRIDDMKKFKLIIIDARRWFDRTYGNTYHSVTVTVKHARKDDLVLP